MAPKDNQFDLSFPSPPEEKRSPKLARGLSKKSLMRRRTPTKRSVSFATEEPSIIPSCSIADVNDHVESTIVSDEIWYSKEDYKAFKEDGNNVMRLAMMKRLGDFEKEASAEMAYCEVGLENKLDPQGTIVRRERRQKAVDAVLEEQYDQHMNGRVYNPESTALVYQRWSGPCRIEARNRALDIERETSEYCQQEREEQQKLKSTSCHGGRNKGIGQIFSALPRSGSFERVGAAYSKLTRKKSSRNSLLGLK